MKLTFRDIVDRYPGSIIREVRVRGSGGIEDVFVDALTPIEDGSVPDVIYDTIDEYNNAEDYNPRCSCEGKWMFLAVRIKGIIYSRDIYNFQRVDEKRKKIHDNNVREWERKKKEWLESEKKSLQIESEKRRYKDEYLVHLKLDTNMAGEPFIYIDTAGNFVRPPNGIKLSKYSIMPKESGDYWIRVKPLSWGGYYEIIDKVTIGKTPEFPFDMYSYSVPVMKD